MVRQRPSSPSPSPEHAQAADLLKTMNQPVPRFHIIGNIYSVGASDITSYLIVTPQGDILIDGGFVQTTPQIEAISRRSASS
jgi:metallo-beta-lactamase class B